MFFELLKNKVEYSIHENKIKDLPKFCGGKIFHINEFGKGAVIYIYFGNLIKEELESLKDLIDTPLNSPFKNYNIETENTIFQSIVLENAIGKTQSRITPSIAQEMRGQKFYNSIKIEEEWKALAMQEFGNTYSLYLQLNKAKFNEYLKQNSPFEIDLLNDTQNLANLENKFNAQYSTLKQNFITRYEIPNNNDLNK